MSTSKQNQKTKMQKKPENFKIGKRNSKNNNNTKYQKPMSINKQKQKDKKEKTQQLMSNMCNAQS